MRLSLLLTMFVLLAVLSGCARPFRRGDEPPPITGVLQTIGTSDPDIAYDAYVCWVMRLYDENPDRAVWIYNGRVLGIGQEGVKALFAELRRLPAESRVIGIPELPIYGAFRNRPLSDADIETLREIMSRGRLWHVQMTCLPSRLKQ